MPTETIGTAAASCKIGAKMQDSSPRDIDATRGGHRPPSIRGGRFTIRRGKRKAPCGATLPTAPMFPSPARQSALLTQVTGKLGGGGGFETGSKKRNGQKAEVEK